MSKRWVLALLLCTVAVTVPAKDVYKRPAAFLEDAFSGTPPAPQVLWIDASMRPKIQEILGHSLAALRVRYWAADSRSAWILEEIGKEEPITVGLVVEDQRIRDLEVLIYRESRGAEVRLPFFTSQFKRAGLTNNGRLDKTIHSVSGATLSARALKRLAGLALYFDKVRLRNEAQ